MSAASSPILVCLNLQRRHTNMMSPHFVPRAPCVLPAIMACVAWARRRGMTLAHVHSQGVEADGRLPIAGCEPRPDEILLFKRGRSFFEHAEFQPGGVLYGRRVMVVGFTSGSDCIAAACDAGRCGAQVVFVEDAISSNSIVGHAPQTVDSIVSAVLGEFAGLARLGDLLAHELTPAERAMPRLLEYAAGE